MPLLHEEIIKRLETLGYQITSSADDIGVCVGISRVAMEKALIKSPPFGTEGALIQLNDLLNIIALFPPHELKDFLDKLETEIYLHKFDILRISGLFPKPTYTIKSGDFNFIRYFKPPLGAQGYVIKPEGAKRFLKYAEKIFIPIDDALDNDFNHKLIIYGYQPYLVEHDWGMGSDVGHRGKLKVSFRVKCCKQALRTWWSIKRLIFTWKNYFIDRFIFKRVV